MTDKIKAFQQQLNLGHKVTLYQFDLRLYDEGWLYLVSGDEGQTVRPVTFDGQLYSPWAIKSEGWELRSVGAFPRPTITLGNTSDILTALVENNNNLEDCMVRRIVTYDRFLDDGVDPDPSQHKPIDEYLINRKIGSVSGESISFELVSPFDQDDTYLPGRQANRDYCPLVYRIFDSTLGDFDYDPDIVTCPYDNNTNGNLMFNENDESVTDPAQDKCGKRLNSCKLRHGSQSLPFGNFPGLARARVG